MTDWLLAAQAATAANALLLAGLGAIWLRSYLELRSKQTLGMLVFASLLFVENAFAFYVYGFDDLLSVWFSTAVPDAAWQAMLAFHAIETLALVFLAWVTWD
jgi:hypothetical protein